MKHLIKTEQHHIDACSQFSIAMALDMTVEEVVNGMGTWSGVTAPDIADFLTRMGYWNGSIDQAGEAIDLSGRGIMIIQTEKSGHCVAFEDGKIYDPNGRTFSNFRNLCVFYTMFDEDRLQWSPRAVMKLEPVKTREWAVGKQKEEAL